MTLKLSECPCGSKKVSIPDFKGQCSDCHMCGPNGNTEELGIIAWNTMVEEIRVGKRVKKAADSTKGYELSDDFAVSVFTDCDERVLQIFLIPIPEPVPDPLALLRLWQFRFEKHADEEDLGLERLLGDTAAVLAQAGEGAAA